MRWTSPVRLVFLLPAVAWVLAFTVFPLGYSLYLAFFKIESKVEVTREKVPVLDDQGEPVLLSAPASPATRTIVNREPGRHRRASSAASTSSACSTIPRS